MEETFEVDVKSIGSEGNGRCAQSRVFPLLAEQTPLDPNPAVAEGLF